MAKNIIGVEFGTNQIKIVEMKGNKVGKFIHEDMPYNVVQNGEIVAWDALAELMAEVVKKNHIKAKEAYVVIPDTAVHVQRLSMPPMTDAQLKVNIPFEFREFIADDKGKHIYDYVVIGSFEDEAGNETGLDVLAVAVPESVIVSYMELFHKLKIKMTTAIPQCIAYGNLMNKIEEGISQKDFIILDFGYLATRVNIFSDGIFDTTKTIDIGCESLVNKVSEQLGCDEHVAMFYVSQNTNGIMDSPSMRDICSKIAVDIMRAINYYSYEKRDNTLETVYVCGGGSVIPQLLDEVKDAIDLKVVPLGSLATKEYPEEILTFGPTALGICFNGK